MGRRHVRALRRPVGLTRTQKRNVLLVVTGTVMCAPQSRQGCGFFPDIDFSFDSAYQGGIGIEIVKRKTTPSTGIMTRVPPCPLAERLLQWIEAERLRRHPRCTHDPVPGVRCRHCPYRRSLSILSVADLVPEVSRTGPRWSPSRPTPRCHQAERHQRREGLHPHARRGRSDLQLEVHETWGPLHGHQC